MAFRFGRQPENEDAAQQATDCRDGYHGPPVIGQLRHMVDAFAAGGRRIITLDVAQRKLLERHQQVEE